MVVFGSEMRYYMIIDLVIFTEGAVEGLFFSATKEQEHKPILFLGPFPFVFPLSLSPSPPPSPCFPCWLPQPPFTAPLTPQWLDLEDIGRCDPVLTQESLWGEWHSSCFPCRVRVTGDSGDGQAGMEREQDSNQKKQPMQRASSSLGLGQTWFFLVMRRDECSQTPEGDGYFWEGMSYEVNFIPKLF